MGIRAGLVGAAVGRTRLRFPTVGELYQAITTGATLTVPNPKLRPERALSTELSFERTFKSGRLRFSIFTEDIDDALISQSAPLVVGSPTLFTYVQNVDKVENRGAELVGSYDDAFVEGLSLTGSVTYVDPEIAEDKAFPAAKGRLQSSAGTPLARDCRRNLSSGSAVVVHPCRAL